MSGSFADTVASRLALKRRDKFSMPRIMDEDARAGDAELSLIGEHRREDRWRDEIGRRSIFEDKPTRATRPKGRPDEMIDAGAPMRQ